MPSKKNERDFVALTRIAVASFRRGELNQASAFSGLSKATTMKRFGAIPSRAVIFSVAAT
jgi:hypothetical protein